MKRESEIDQSLERESSTDRQKEKERGSSINCQRVEQVNGYTKRKKEINRQLYREKSVDEQKEKQRVQRICSEKKIERKRKRLTDKQKARMGSIVRQKDQQIGGEKEINR